MLKSKQTLLSVAVGFTLGCMISYVLLNGTGIHRIQLEFEPHNLSIQCINGQSALAPQHVPRQSHDHAACDAVLRQLRQSAPWNYSKSHSHLNENLIADKLKSKVRIFCWIMTSPRNHKSKAVHLKATWVKRCNNYVFMSTRVDPALPSVDLKVREGYNNIWAKTKAAFKYVYDHHMHDYDYFLKADDDTYVVVENLRYMLRKTDPNRAWYAGRRFKPFVKQGFMSGGAGYVLSREAVKLFIERALPGKNGACKRDNKGAEDVNMGSCMESIGVPVLDSIDELGRERFHPYTPESHLLLKGIPKWLFKNNYYPLKSGPDCCSDTTVSFHYVSPSLMYVLDYFVYHLKPYGVVRDYEAVRAFILDELKSKLSQAAAQNKTKT